MQFVLSDYKKYFSIPEGQVYLNCAAHGPLSKAASDAVSRAMRDKEHPAQLDHNYGIEHVQKCRDAVSKLIQWPAQNIALANSTTWGINILAQGLELNGGDEIIFFEGQFPSNSLPWIPLEKRGIKIVKVPNANFIADLGAFKKRLSSKTKVACLEWVHFVSGDLIPLQEITELCHKQNVIVVVDVTQGAGAIPFSMKKMGVDAVVCSAYKWLYSPYGSGFFALTDELIKEISPNFVNWLSLDMQWADNFTQCELKLYSTAARFDAPSQMGYFNLDGMTASIEWLSTLDVSRNFKEVKQLIRQLQNELDPHYFSLMNSGPEERQSLIANFLCPKVPGAKIMDELKSNGFTCCSRNGGLRIAPSLYNDSNQILEFSRIANRFARNNHN